MAINLPSSKPQANVATLLEEFRKLFLQEALSTAIQAVELSTLNKELAEFSNPEDLKKLATCGIRGEFVFSVPCILTVKPNLLGYYRLLLGYSQKEFYSKSKLGRFKCMEDSGRLGAKLTLELPNLCTAMNTSASILLNEIGKTRLSTALLHELSLLTLGPQLRGSNNTQIGILANRAVFEIIHSIVKPAIISASESRLELLNAAKRRVIIAFSADPDISIYEEIAPGKYKNIVAIEIKGGADFSNIWNRLGEAEKSHQSAKRKEFVEFWTIYNVQGLNLQKAREKSPTTSRFYSLIQLSSSGSDEMQDFQQRIISIVGIPT